MKIKDESGNTTLFVIGFFGIFSLMFLLIANFANVLIEKQHASNNADQASIVASGILLDALDEAIDEYDRSILEQLLEGEIEPEKLRDKVNDEIQGLSSDKYNETEKRHIAINNVLKRELPGNGLLESKVSSRLAGARDQISTEVQNNILKNNGKVEETTISLNDKNRIEVKTSTRYEAVKFDEYLSENQRYIKQTGHGPSFDFLEAMNWPLDISL